MLTNVLQCHEIKKISIKFNPYYFILNCNYYFIIFLRNIIFSIENFFLLFIKTNKQKKNRVEMQGGEKEVDAKTDFYLCLRKGICNA